MTKLFLAMPSYLGKPAKETRQSMKKAREALRAAGVPFVEGTQKGICYICHARNLLVKAFLETDCTDFVFIDDDVSFEPEALFRLLSVPHMITAGVYRKKVDDWQWPCSLKAPLLVDEYGCAEAHHLPTGFMRIRRGVFEQMERTVPVYEADAHGRVVAFFMTGIRDGKFWGEDVAFVSNWRQFGGTIHALLDVSLGHTRAEDGRVFRGNLARWIAEQTQRAA